MVTKIINDWFEQAVVETVGVKVKNKKTAIPQLSTDKGELQMPKPLFTQYTKGIDLKPDFLPQNLENIERKILQTTSINLDNYTSDIQKDQRGNETDGRKFPDIEYSRENIYLSRVIFNLFEMPDSSVSKTSAQYQNVVERNELYLKALQKHEQFPQYFMEKGFQTDVIDSAVKQIETIPLGMKNKSCMVNSYFMKRHYDRSERKTNPPPKTFEEFRNSKTKFCDYEELLKNIVIYPEIFNCFKNSLYVLEKTLNYNTFQSSILEYNISMLKNEVITLNKNESFDEIKSDFIKQCDTKLHLFFHLENMENNYQVMCIRCSPINPSIFVVGYGISQFKEMEYDPRGMVLCWNIHKSGHPEKIFYTEEIVTCLEFSKNEPYLVGVGMRYGLIAIFDLRKSNLFSLLNNFSSKMKPLSTVQNVQWTTRKYATGKETEVLLSVSLDGSICCWSQDRILDGQIIRSIKREENTTERQKVSVAVDTVGMCMQMKPNNDNIFLVATIEGQVLQADLNDPDSYNFIYNAHNGPVYNTEWSHLVSDVFMTCGTDHFIHIWQEGRSKPSKSLVLEEVAVKVAWSYTKSTLFAALCDKKVLVFDLTVNLHKEITEITIEKGLSFRDVTFCPKNDWILAGQSDGITSLFEIVNIPSLRTSQEEALKSTFLSES